MIAEVTNTPWGERTAYPPMTLATLGRIYANALRLKRKGAPFFSHPRPAGT